MKLKFCFFFLLSIKLFSQFDSSLDVSVPQTSDFIRYGNIPVSKYTGQLDLSIPLFSTQTKYFNVDLNMRYNSSGFIPSKQSSAIGLNWFLNTGGVITRKVNHIPDEVQDRLYSNGERTFGPAIHGYFYGIKKRKHSKSLIFNNGDISSGKTLSINGSPHTDDVGPANGFTAEHYESNSDEFFFNFNGLSGKFFMDNEGKVRVVCNQPVHIKVDLNNFGSYKWLSLQNSKGPGTMSNSQIVLTTDDGIKYYFGGDISALEYSFFIGFYNEIPLHPTYTPSINSWHLSKVVAPNGDTMEYEYMDNFPKRYDRDSYNNDNEKAPFPIIVHKQHKFLKGNSFLHGSAWQPNGKLGDVSSEDAALTAVKTVYLKKIKVSKDLVIDFDYSVKAHKFYKNTDYARSNAQSHFGATYNVKAYKLDEITVRGNGSRLERVVFNYDYSGGNYKRMFLRSVYKYGTNSSLGDAKKYQMQYNGLDVNKRNAPAPDTFGLDHWGFWNLKNSNRLEDLAPRERVNSSGDVTGFSSTNRNPNFIAASYGLISKITYPTKGYSLFEYEAHRYSKRIEFKSANFFRPKLYNVNGLAGGARIRSIKNYDTNNVQVLSKEFKYSPNKNNTSSSGVLLQWPRYSFSYTQRIGSDKQLLTANARALASYNPTIIDDSHITYANVVEINSGGDYNISNFTTYESNPDTVAKIYEKDEFSINPPRIGYLLGGNYVNSRKIERGKLKNYTSYSSDNKIVNKKEYKYNTIPTRLQDYSVEGFLSQTYRRSYVKRYYYNNHLGQISDLNYYYNDEDSDPDIVRTSNVYNYNKDYNKLTKENFYTSKGVVRQIQKEYKYPFSNNFNSEINSIWTDKSTVLNTMISRNFLPVIEEEVKLVDYGISELLNAKITTYKSEGLGWPIVNKIYNWEKDGFYEAISYDSYNNYGNPIQITRKDGISTKYIWDKSGRYLMAKIENFPQGSIPANVNSVFHNIENGPFPSSYHDSFTFNRLRNDSFFKNSFITNYVHKPYVGLLSIKDARDYKTSFTYDSHNRLKEVKDADGNLVSKNKYNYKNN